MFRNNVSSLYSRSFLNPNLTDKENNPQEVNRINAIKSKGSLDITEKMSKFPPTLAASHNFSQEMLKKIAQEKNKKNNVVKNEPENCEQIKSSQEDSYRDKENVRLNQVYSRDIVQFLIENEPKNNEKNSLERHKIPANLRAKMIDWMVEVLSSYKCKDQTFFVSVVTMDNYFKHCQKTLEITDLHLIGVACMFIANKYEEIYPLKLKTIYEKIAHKKLSIDQIKNKEIEILQALNYNLNTTTTYEYMTLALNSLELKQIINHKTFEYLEKVSLYLLKMMMHENSLLIKQKKHELAASIIFVTFKIIEQLDPDFPVEAKAKEIREFLQVDEDIFYETASRVLNFAKNFEKIYPNFENLKKFNGFALDDDENSKESILFSS